MQRTYLVCELCGKEISKPNYIRHLRGHQNHPENYENKKYALNHDGLVCQFCGKECKNRNSLCNHERLCRNNPNKQEGQSRGMTGKISWNHGLTKETDERIASASKKSSATKTGRPGHAHTEAEKEYLRECALKNGLGGFNWRRGIYYNGVKLDSSYEVIVAESLDANNIKWERPGKFLYYMDNKEHYYTPDFYLPDYNIYLDPKNDYLINNVNPTLGYTDKDKIDAVMKENNVKVLILNKDQLVWDVIKTLI